MFKLVATSNECKCNYYYSWTQGKYKKEITELDFDTENRWASNFVSIIKCTFIVKNKITDKT